MSWRHKKRSYNIIRLEDSKWNWCYSADELEKTLNDLCRGQKLLCCMAELHGYLDAVPRGDNYLDLSYMGGNTLMIFDGIVVEFDIRVEGLIGYRVAKPWNMSIRPVNDRIPEDYITNPIYFCNVKSDFVLDYEGHTVRDVKIDHTNLWGFSAKGFDEEIANAAAEANDLPGAIHFALSNGVVFCLIADQLEYYMIELRHEKSIRDIPSIM